jgi:heptosyltransferase II
MEIVAKKWEKDSAPRRLLAIRLQAMGDLVITLPYLQHLKRALPLNTELDLLTRKEVEDIPRHIRLFDRVYSIGGGRDLKRQFIHSFWILPRLMRRGYDVVIDLQDNPISGFFRKSLRPKAWSIFDRFSPAPAGERTRMTIEAIGLGKSTIDTGFQLKDPQSGNELLRENGWNGIRDLVILNPAGAFPSRNWPVEKYAEFAKIWLRNRPNSQFLLMGTGLIQAKSDYLKKELDAHLINLVNRTSPFEAFAILQKSTFVLSEDSGLMHMAWVSGIPTLVLFGSTRSVWARPLGEHSAYLDSTDLECGPCMQETCRFGDTHCLTRYSAEMVYEKAEALLRLGPFRSP